MRRGFSLVELSIVLVIFGLLVGGILAGRSLIHAAELRGAANEYSRYTTAIRAFQDKYMAVPGDMTNATSFWGAGTCPGTNATPSTTQATCDGDGDKKLIFWSVSSNEAFRFWQHLANAGMVEGMYAGVSNNATYSTGDSKLGWNVPVSKLPNAGWTAYFVGSRDYSSTAFFEGNYGNVFYYGAVQSGNLTGGSALFPEDAWNIDTKLDDGKPGTGLVTVMEAATTCHDATPSSAAAIGPTANYQLGSTVIGCALLMKTGTGY